MPKWTTDTGLDSRPKRHQAWLLYLLLWRGAHSRRSGADVRSAAISLTSVCEYWLVGGSPEMGRLVGYQFQRQALTQSLSRNDTELG